MGTLYIVATPIGNITDITIRALHILFSVPYIACEDTRRTGQLLASLKAKYNPLIQTETGESKLISFYDEVEENKTPEILDILTQGKNVALVSDAGTPLISDPGYKLVRECMKRGIIIVPIPGPSALITALTISGLPPDTFLFLGYLPAKKTKRIQVFQNILSIPRPRNQLHRFLFTVILYESPHRLQESLEDMEEVFGDIEIVIVRELTKIHEEVWRGKISTLSEKAEHIQGEIVLLFRIPQE